MVTDLASLHILVSKESHCVRSVSMEFQSKQSTMTQRMILLSSLMSWHKKTCEPITIPKSFSIHVRHKLYTPPPPLTHTCVQKHQTSLFVSNTNALPVTSCLGYSSYNWRGTKPKVTVPGIDVSAGLKYRLPLSLCTPSLTPSCCWILFPFFFWSNGFLFCPSYTSHLGETW